MMKTVHFRKTREYLEQVKDAARKVEMLKKRIALYEKAGMDVGTLPDELEEAMRNMTLKKVGLSDMIARIPRVEYQWLLTKRYVDLLSWDDIACENNSGYRKVVSTHGFALPEMQDVLVEAGVVAPEEADDISLLLPEEGTLDTGTMEDYLKYREEKKTESGNQMCM
ncbi:MAG: hypothetical protein IJQ88_11700 [Clostridia bacterium]|nr:hypothetical protein [Clostridia bacterium]